ncbi:unnamed protein product [Acanthoscelides obtectus]|uniref:HAT C-terminal dimerisation domain-containing protein n=1 Tax=Acanthoscelides obtectus TaxID=200917 RepID=A0A9P0P5U9_ACAOB|nr:unnamed protein product [Acanthoscelides obtectus]CAK1628111.1 hypothetical protein AOBTE_LOCUS5036 [Acanthoscelides obtectus]
MDMDNFLDFIEWVEYVGEAGSAGRMPKRYIRDAQNPFEFYEDVEFKRRYRFSKCIVIDEMLPLVACGLNLEILNLVARHPGSTHDNVIFGQSGLQVKFENNEVQDTNRKKLEDLLPQALKSSTEAESIRQKFEDRQLHAFKPIHLAASLLDPRSQELIMIAQQQTDRCEVICQIGRNINNIDDQNLMVELAMYRYRESIWRKKFVWKTAENESISALLWWKTFYQNTDLEKVAIRILSVPSTSASVERSSTFSFVHDKKRHKRNTNRAGKLCYIVHNCKAWELGAIGVEEAPLPECIVSIDLASLDSILAMLEDSSV